MRHSKFANKYSSAQADNVSVHTVEVINENIFFFSSVYSMHSGEKSNFTTKLNYQAFCMSV